MVIASSTRPPTSQEDSSASQGEDVSDVPIPGVAAWEDVLQAEPPEAGAPAEAVPPGAGALPGEAGAPMQAGPPPVARSPDGDLASVGVDPAQLTAHPTTLPPRGSHTPPPETPLPVLLLVDQARSASGVERQELSRRINRWLDQMVRDGGSRHVADWFHHLIESGRLEGLADAAGHDCHETAIQGLLAMGFPYALEIRPEDLERIKPRELRAQDKDKKLKGAAGGLVAGGVLLELVLNLLRAKPLTGLLTVEVGIELLALVALLFSTPRTPLRNLGLAVLLVVSVLSVSLGFLAGYAGMVSGLAGLLVVLLFAFHRS